MNRSIESLNCERPLSTHTTHWLFAALHRCLFLFPFLGLEHSLLSSLTRTSIPSFRQNKRQMATTKSASDNFSMDDFDALLAALSSEDLEKVNDLIDPEVSDCSCASS